MPCNTARCSREETDDSAEQNAELASGLKGLGKGERRRAQNRLSQQVFRQRQRMKKEVQIQSQKQALELENAVPRTWTWTSGPDLDSITRLAKEERQRENSATECRLVRPDTYNLLSLFESAAYRSYLGNPSTDHRLTLVKLNVFRAFERNISALGYTRAWMTDNAISRFSVAGPVPDDLPQTIPPGLQPTALQKSQKHHPWLDFFPFAHLRDELILIEDDIDDSQLCRDLMGFWTMPSEGDNCMLVWGNPWEPMNWEVTETFLRKWGFLVKGCPEIIWSSNYWRRQRGEAKLKWRVSFKQADGSPVD